MAPATWAALIVGAFFVFFFALFAYWVSREANRVKKQRESRLANSGTAGDMTWINSGSFTMGGIGPLARLDELPLHDVKINGFWVDQDEVTNAEFALFVEQTKYVTTAERPRSRKDDPSLAPELEGKAFSFCFAPTGENSHALGWHAVVGASWQHPYGPTSNWKGLEKHPVVHVSWDDALAYAHWAGKRLLSEAEWEFAARGGLVAQVYGWGSELKADGRWMANLWQGALVEGKKPEDGFVGTSPGGSFPTNGFGLFDMAGNVAEWTADWYRPDIYLAISKSPARIARRNPQGPIDSFDPEQPGIWKKVIRGGSFLSVDGADSRPSARAKGAVPTTRQDLGFRCAKDQGE